jgi:ATP-dependent Clp protease ATP-binding subunit ClpC
MFERFTDRARRVVLQAQIEARSLDHNYIGTEHLLLALIDEGSGVAAKALESMQISADTIRQQVEEIIGRGLAPPSAGHIPFTPRAKKVLELSLREALQLGHHYIGTEHVLLGLIREGDGVAGQVLVNLGVDLDRTRQQIIEILTGRLSATVVVAGVPAAGVPAAGLLAAAGPAGTVGASAGELRERLASMAARLAVIERRLRDAADEPG